MFNQFKDFKNLVENHTSNKIKCLRTNNGSEFCFAYFERYYKDHGIKKHKTTPCSLLQNGVSERLNRTLMERVRSMLRNVGLDQNLWARLWLQHVN
jgi:transposase InsO family protein